MYSFDIAGLLGVKTTLNAINIPSFFKVKHLNSPADLTLCLGYYEGVRKNSEDRILNLQGRKLILKNLEGKTLLQSFSDRYRLFRQLSINEKNLIKALLQIKLLQKNHSFIHSACLAKKGEGILISAPSNTGKTFTSMELALNQGFEFLSDDMTIIAPNGTAYCYPIPMTIGRTHIDHFHIDLTMRERLNFRFKNFIFKIPWIRLLFPEFRFEPVRLGIKAFRKTVSIKTLCLLEVGTKGKSEVKHLSKASALQKLWMNNRMNLRFFELPELMVYSQAYPTFDLDVLMSTHKKILKDLLNNVNQILLIKCGDRRFDKRIIDLFS